MADLFNYRGDTVEIDTWYQGEGRIETRRDWIIRDDKTGDTIGRATRYLTTLPLLTKKTAGNLLYCISRAGC